MAPNTTRAGFEVWLRRNFPGHEGGVSQLYAPVGVRKGWWWAASQVLGDYIMTCPHRRAARILAGSDDRDVYAS